MKKSKKNYVLVALLAILVALAVGYSAFATQLNISGTATAKGDWKVYFSAATASGDVTGCEAKISSVAPATDNKITITGLDFKKPGESETIKATIKNDGSVDAKLTGFNVVAKSGTSTVQETALEETSAGVYKYGVLKLTVEDWTSQKNTQVIASEGSEEYTITAEWDDSVDADEVDDGIAFDITFNYEQN